MLWTKSEDSKFLEIYLQMGTLLILIYVNTEKKESNIFIVLLSVKIKEDFNNVDLLDVKVFSHSCHFGDMNLFWQYESNAFITQIIIRLSKCICLQFLISDEANLISTDLWPDFLCM